MKHLILTAALMLAPGLAMAEASNDTTCKWVPSPGSNVLMRSGDCDDGLTGGSIAKTTITVERIAGEGCDPDIERTTTRTVETGRPSEREGLSGETVTEREIASAD